MISFFTPSLPFAFDIQVHVLATEHVSNGMHILFSVTKISIHEKMESHRSSNRLHYNIGMTMAWDHVRWTRITHLWQQKDLQQNQDWSSRRLRGEWGWYCDSPFDQHPLCVTDSKMRRGSEEWKGAGNYDHLSWAGLSFTSSAFLPLLAPFNRMTEHSRKDWEKNGRKRDLNHMILLPCPEQETAHVICCFRDMIDSCPDLTLD